MKQLLTLFAFLLFFCSCRNTTETIYAPYGHIKRLKAETRGNVRTSYSYDLLGRVGSVFKNGSFLRSYTYTPEGKIETVAFFQSINPATLEEGTSLYKYNYDDNGLLIKRYFSSFNNVPTTTYPPNTVYAYDDQNRRIWAVSKNNIFGGEVKDSSAWSDFDRGKPRLNSSYTLDQNGNYYLYSLLRFTYDERMNVSMIEDVVDIKNPGTSGFYLVDVATFDESIPVILFNNIPDTKAPPTEPLIYNNDRQVTGKSYSKGGSLVSTTLGTVSQKDDQGYPVSFLITTTDANGKVTTSTVFYEWE